MSQKRGRGTDGLLFSSKKNRSAPPKVRERKLKYLSPTTTNLNQGGVIEFHETIHGDDWVRFTDTPIYIEYRATYNNPDYSDTSTDEPARLNARANEYKPAVIFPPELGLQSLYSKIEVLVDGYLVGSDSDMSGHNAVYQRFNRLYSRQSQRSKVNQNSMILNTRERSNGNPAENAVGIRNKLYKIAAERTTHVQATGDTKLLDRFTFDGNFAVSPPFNYALSNLSSDSMRKTNRNNFFPPNTSIVVRLHPRFPQLCLLDYTQIAGVEIYDPALKALNVDVGLEIRISKICLHCEVVTFGSDVTKALLERPLKYTFNNVFIDKISLEPNHQQISVASQVPAGAKLAYLGFMCEHHLWYNEKAKRNLSNYMMFPTTLKSLFLKLGGHGYIISDYGLHDLGGLRGHMSPSLRSYYSDLREKGLTDIPFEEVFPKYEPTTPLAQTLLADLRPYKLNSGGRLDLTMAFDGALSPSGIKLVVCYVMEKTLTREKDRKWKASSSD